MVTTLPTLEMRWFLPGLIPQDVMLWFQQHCPGDPIDRGSERVDRYLSLPGCDVVGIKLRAEKFEVKWRTQVVGQPICGTPMNFGEEKWARSQPSLQQGQLERWQKVSYGSLLDAGAIAQAARSPGVWVSVHKQRQLRCEQGVQIGLVQLSVKQQMWWSFSLEETQSPSANQCFESVLWQLAQIYPGPSLTAEDSYAFPSWLSRFSLPSELWEED